MLAVDQVQLNFNPAALATLNGILAVVMFGVALDLKWTDFRRVLQAPWAPVVGLSCQFLLMPAIATAILMVLQPAPSVALGMILVAACPGGNFSNFLASVARGNAALSISMSSISTLAAIVMTPLNFLLWGSLNPNTAPLLKEISLSPADIVSTVFTILILPTLLGMALAHWRPRWAAAMLRPMRRFSIGVLFVFVAGAVHANYQVFLDYISVTFWVVLIINAVALALGYWAARLARLNRADARAVCFETGIQNSGFGLILCFNFFAGLGGMAIAAAWWGIWHLISGLAVATYWSRRDPEAVAA